MNIIKSKVAQFLAEEDINHVLEGYSAVICTTNDEVLRSISPRNYKAVQMKKFLGLSMPDIDRVRLLQYVDYYNVSNMVIVEHSKALDSHKRVDIDKKSKTLIYSSDAKKLEEFTTTVVEALSTSMEKTKMGHSSVYMLSVDAVLDGVALYKPVEIEKGVGLDNPTNAVSAIFSALKDKKAKQIDEAVQ